MDVKSKLAGWTARTAARFPRTFWLLWRGVDRSRDAWRAHKPGPRAWRGAALGLLVATIVVVADAVLHRAMLPYPTATRLVGALRQIRDGVLAGVGLVILAAVVSRLPWRYRLALGACGGVLAGAFPFSQDDRALVWGIVAFSLAGAGLAAISREDRASMPASQRRTAVAAIVFGLVSVGLLLYWMFSSGFDALAYRDAARLAAGEEGARVDRIELADPSQPGTHNVLTLTYGSGKDIRRPEFGRDADLLTDSVDGRPFLDGWDDERGRERSGFWGFDRDELPLQARVWYPDGDGPFPLVLIVHGNHSMYEYSDPGYRYLGELLASRGYILASVDENFINGGIGNENDARGWLLLEHLRVWKQWSQAGGSTPFAGKVDMGRVALIGHSRGGEAVAVAAAFNRLPYYPDDATVAFDYGFDIGAVVAIAPVMGQYQPGGRYTDVRDVDYLVLHGANDGDVSSFNGAGQWEHVHFSGAGYHFKTSVYAMGANHGQFNMVWGDHDSGPPFGRSLNTRALIPDTEQRRIAEVYISAFLDATLRGETGYMPLFIDARAGADWLPQTAYLVEFDDSRSLVVATFDEDVDVTTATIPGGHTRGEGLNVWREQRIEMKSRTKETAGVYVGWKVEEEEGDEVAEGTTPAPAAAPMRAPRYIIELPAGFSVDAAGALFFAAADADESADVPEHLRPNDDEVQQQEPVGDDPAAAPQAADKETSEDAEEEADDDAPREPIDFTVRLVDAAGAVADLPLSRFSMVQPQLQVQLRKALFDEPRKESEAVFQSFVLPLAWFVEVNPELDAAHPARIEIVFDRSLSGVLIFDGIGFRPPLPARGGVAS